MKSVLFALLAVLGLIAFHLERGVLGTAFSLRQEASNVTATSSGHVVAYNYIADFHDGINVETYGNPDGSVASGPDIPDGPKYPPREFWDRRPVAIDFYNNYITNSHDNPIEADGSMHNIRIMRNMLINHASHAFCNQPALGGPVYWIRNIAYNLPGGSTRLTSGSMEVIFYNNIRNRRQSPEHALAQQSHVRSELECNNL